MMTKWCVRLAIGFVGVAPLISCSHSSSSSPSSDWPMFGGNLLHTFTQANPTINSTNVAQLTTAWTFPVSDAVSASPSVVNGVVYVGAWDGFFYALDATSGALKWKFQLDCQNGILPIPPRCLGGMAAPDRTGTDGGLVTSSATVIDGHVYFGGGRTLYCLNVADGSLVWKHVICGNPDDSNCQNDAADPTNIFSSPTVFDGKVIFRTHAGRSDGLSRRYQRARRSDGQRRVDLRGRSDHGRERQRDRRQQSRMRKRLVHGRDRRPE